ncbi:MAG: LCP family protein [Clostridia bacterium]|nr:LCP family protein [Clostridia bacterium]
MSDNEKKVSAEMTENTDKKEKKPMSKKKKTLVIILCILLAFFLFAGGFAIWYVNDKLNRIDYDTEQTTIAPNQEFVDDEMIDFAEMDDATGNSFREILKNWATNGGEKMSDKNILNVLLIGSDASSTEAGRASITDKGNTDVMMLVSINKAEKKIKLVSFMRDSYTYMDQFDSYAKLNAACANGGAPYLVETIENDYKIEIDGYALVDFDSFTDVIDVLGGVQVDVPAYVANYLSSEAKGVYFPRGENVLLNGEQALRFARVRKTDKDGDVSRVARQRQVVNALIDKCVNASLSDINEVFDVVLANVRTNIPKKDILSYATKAVTEGWAKYEISEFTMPTEDARRGYSSASTAWIWVVDYPLVAQKLQLELYGETNIKLPEERTTALDVIK